MYRHMMDGSSAPRITRPRRRDCAAIDPEKATTVAVGVLTTSSHSATSRIPVFVWPAQGRGSTILSPFRHVVDV
jgi:hypothetical protein